MDMHETVAQHPLLGILRNVPLDKTADYVGAAVAGGCDFFEVALNSSNALKQISLLRSRFGDRCLVGAGTAVTVDLCKAAVDAGAQFLLTPGTPLNVFAYCAKNGLSLLPGVLSPFDVATSLEFGFRTMKLFPAGSMPLSYVKDLKGPFSGTYYMAIGGVGPENIGAFFQAGYLGVGLASSLMPKKAVAENDWEACTDYVRDLMARITVVNH